MCDTYRQGDEVFCKGCQRRWDANEPSPCDEEIARLSGQGRKDDTGKAPYDLIAPEMLDALAAVLDFGARKYEPHNWAKGMRWGRCFAALMRHLWAWWSGRGDNDPETGMSHLWHAAACLMFLIAYEARKVGDDDRHRHPLSL